MSQDRRKILDMLADGQIDADAAERLLGKLTDLDTQGVPEQGELMPREPRYLRIHGHAEGGKFDIRLPLALIKTGIKLEAMLPNSTRDGLKEHGVDLGEFAGMAAEELVQALGELAINVDGDDGEQVRIYCE